MSLNTIQSASCFDSDVYLKSQNTTLVIDRCVTFILDTINLQNAKNIVSTRYAIGAHHFDYLIAHCKRFPDLYWKIP